MLNTGPNSRSYCKMSCWGANSKKLHIVSTLQFGAHQTTRTKSSTDDTTNKQIATWRNFVRCAGDLQHYHAYIADYIRFFLHIFSGSLEILLSSHTAICKPRNYRQSFSFVGMDEGGSGRAKNTQLYILHSKEIGTTDTTQGGAIQASWVTQAQHRTCHRESESGGQNTVNENKNR